MPEIEDNRRKWMLALIIRVLYLSVCAVVIAAMVLAATSGGAGYPATFAKYPVGTFLVLLLLTQLVTLFDIFYRGKRAIDVISSVYFGLLVGAILAYTLVQAIDIAMPPKTAFREVILPFPLLIIPYVCVMLILQTKDDFRFVVPYIEFQRELRGNRPWIIDTSALIDGRIADVVETAIFDNELVVPTFVLGEVQDIADSSDKNRRLRGRRGLDILEKLKASEKAEVRLHDERAADGDSRSVDQRIVDLAQSLNAGVITNDFSLNRISSVQGITVVNLNDVANALKPRYIPGEQLQIRVMKAGESTGQGVGYLDDGTMVVCENADHLIGERLSVTVTSVLQKSEGRMIFGKPSGNQES